MESSKYQLQQPTDQEKPPLPQPAHDLAEEYGDTRLILLPRDPEWMFAYWEINQQIRNALEIPRHEHDRRMVIRAYDITGLEEFTGVNAHNQFDIEINDYASSWYVRTGLPNRSWCADLGLLNEKEECIQITRSNTICSPANDTSEFQQEHWMSPGEEVERALDLPASIRRELSRSEELGQRQAQRLASESLQASGAASEQRFPGSSELARKPFPQQREFWLMVDTELIVYGATEPTAKVTIQGREAQVQPDGTFSARFALPNGQQTIPIEAVAQDGEQSRRIVSTVKKKTG